MNWPYIGIAALLPLVMALGLTLAAGAIQAVRLNREGGASRAALLRLLRTMALVFPLAFLAAAFWDGRRTWRGLLGVALHRPVDQQAMGVLRLGGRGFLSADPAKAFHWFQKAADGGDAESQLFLARALRSGQGLPHDPERALHWAQAAADRGLPDAMVLAGDLLSPSNLEAANLRYRQALAAFQGKAQQRDADACLAYGLMHTTGKGTPKDPVEGLAWMLIARRLGMDPFKAVIIQFSESTLTKPQRAEAALRAQAIEKTLAPKGKS
ncbi:MAG TPA: tetratricopeptide repeat protein [Geothrix sp.]|jgi:hypothetical protein